MGNDVSKVAEALALDVLARAEVVPSEHLLLVEVVSVVVLVDNAGHPAHDVVDSVSIFRQFCLFSLIRADLFMDLLETFQLLITYFVVTN